MWRFLKAKRKQSKLTCTAIAKWIKSFSFCGFFPLWLIHVRRFSLALVSVFGRYTRFLCFFYIFCVSCRRSQCYCCCRLFASQFRCEYTRSNFLLHCGCVCVCEKVLWVFVDSLFLSEYLLFCWVNGDDGFYLLVFSSSYFSALCWLCPLYDFLIFSYTASILLVAAWCLINIVFDVLLMERQAAGTTTTIKKHTTTTTTAIMADCR